MNLVFEKEVTEEKYRLVLGLHLGNVTVTHIDYLRKDTNYINIQRVYGYPSQDIENGTLSIHDSLLKKYKEGYDISFMFLTLHESDEPTAVERITKYIRELGIEESSVYFVCGNELLDYHKKECNSKINVHTTDIIPQVISRSMHVDGQHEFSLDRENIFQCYNRAEKSHRIATSVFLHKEDLLKDTDFSLRCSDVLYKRNEYSYNWNGIIDEREIDSYNENLKSLCNTDKQILSNYENFQFDVNGPQHNLTYIHNLYKHSYINIVTETQYEWDGIIHITEKSLQPLWFYQLPIIIATPHHIKRMRELYDFDWFDDFLNHSYDSQENHALRFHKIRREILRLSKMKSDVKKFFKENKKRFEHNREVVRELQYSKHDINFFKSIQI